MPTPKIAQKSPYIVDENPGKKVWCSCGQSSKQPYCDGSHSGTDFSPEFVHIDTAKKVAWCGCKQTKTPPYCDGSHLKI